MFSKKQAVVLFSFDFKTKIKITRLSNSRRPMIINCLVQEYYKITRLSNPVLSSNRLLIVQEYYKITRLSNTKVYNKGTKLV